MTFRTPKTSKAKIAKQNTPVEYDPDNPNPIKHSLYAFWESDKFPHLSHGPVVNIAYNGTMAIVGYPEEKRVLPVLVLPFEAGVIMGAELDKQAADYFRVSHSLKAKACRGVMDLHPAFSRVEEITDHAAEI